MQPTRPATAKDPSRRLGTTFLKDNMTSDNVLPKPLPEGIPYVVNFTSFEDLVERRILSREEETTVHLTLDDCRLLYEAKCKDQDLKSTWEREVRFLELLSANCQGNTFSLRENGLGRYSAEAISHVLAKNIHYSVVDLSGNRFRNAGAAIFAQLLDINDSIVHLSLKSNDIGPDGLSKLLHALKSNITLTSLDLSGISGINRNHLGVQGCTAMSEMLKQNRTIYALDISSNGIGPDGAEELARGLQVNAGLGKLAIASNNLGPNGARPLAKAISGCRLEVVDLQRNAMTDRGAAALAQELHPPQVISETLVTLDLSFNDFRAGSGQSIADVISVLTSLKQLLLIGNPLASGAQPICAACRDSNSLIELVLQDCCLRKSEGQSVAQLLSGNRNLQRLDVSKNRLGDEGVIPIADAIGGAVALTSMTLNANGIGDRGGVPLAKSLRGNRKLQELNIRQNLMSEAGDHFAEVLSKNTALLRLDFTYNDFKFEAHESVVASLARNNELWKKSTAPRLQAEIETMDRAEKELREVQDMMDAERRAIKKSMDDGYQKKETLKGRSENNRKEMLEMELQLKDLQVTNRAKDQQLQEVVDEDQRQRSRMDTKVTNLRNRIDSEIDRREKITREIDRLRKTLKSLQEAEDANLKPLAESLKVAQGQREFEQSNAQRQAEMLVNAELKMIHLERSMSVRSQLGASVRADKKATKRK